jgi:serine phosphatase RsbU (regulator of sigma subunit)
VWSAFTQAWASWKSAPGVALLAVVAFAVGIGSATAIFTVINGVLLRPLPYPDSERFVAISGARATQPGIFNVMSVPEVRDYEQQTTSFDVFGWFRAAPLHLTAPGEPQFVDGTAVSPSLARSSARRSSANGSPPCASRRPTSFAADPVRRRRAPAPHRLRECRHAAAGALRRPRPRDGDPRRTRRVAVAARAALLRRGRAGLCRGRHRHAGVRLAVPLRTRREILGVLLLGDRPHRAGFSAHETQVLRAGADQLALMIENARLTKRVVEQETLRRDIALASDVQRRLLPDAPPRSESVDFAAASVPARRIGGDYYDFVEVRDGRIGIALADVSGKGVAAALIMSVVQASLRIIASESDVSPPRLVARINEFVYRSTPTSKYATFFYAQLDEPRRELRYVNAGHNPPYLFRAGGRSATDAASAEIEQLSVGGTVVGMFPEMGYEDATVELHPGDVLLAFTDGVPEAHNPESEEFGEERLQQLPRQTAHLPADEISARISAEMKDWIRDAEQYDDLTFIVMKVR